jgi:DNA-binding response OmpR family regulator
MMSEGRILVVEDEPALASLIADYLAADGFSVETRHDGPSGLQAALVNPPDLVLLDVMLPGLDGFELCRRLRQESNLPVLMLSARREDGDKIRGLGLGADDYVTKPFSPAELVARVRSHLARYLRLTGSSQKPDGQWLIDGDLEFNPLLRLVKRDGHELAITAKEYELLALFIQNPDRVFTKDELYERVWGDEQFRDTGTVVVHVRRLREKIERRPSEPAHIETVWGMGYRWRRTGL